MASNILFRSLLLGGLTLAGVIGSGITARSAHAQVVVELGVEPPRRSIETYPHTRYADRDVYWADDHWYYRRGPRWYYYRDEPPALRYHRVHVIERPRYRARRVYREPPPRVYERPRHREHSHRHDRHDHRDVVLVR